MIGFVKSNLSSSSLPFITYSVLSIIVLWNLILPGYVLALDMVFSPTIPFPHAFYGFDGDPIQLLGLPFNLGLWALNLLFPAWLIQKTLLFLVFLLAGLGGYALCQAKSALGRFFAGFMYMLNPFVYVRFMVGHYRLLLAYSIFPFLIKSFTEFTNEPQLKYGVKLALVSTLILVLDAHFVYVAGLALLTLFIFRILSSKGSHPGLKRLVGWSGVATAIFAAMNLYWIIPLLMFQGIDVHTGVFTYKDLLAFTSRAWGTGLNIFFTLASLYGFWRMPEGYRYVSETLYGWQLIYFLILYLTLQGFIALQSDPSRAWFARGMAASGVATLVLACGVSSAWTAPIFESFFAFSPFFSGMRESQKFLAMLALVYSFLGGYGVSELYVTLKEAKNRPLRHCQKIKQYLLAMLIGASLLSPFIYSYTQLFGFNGQLRNLEYPHEWYDVKAILGHGNSDYRVLVLPWHMYMYQSWIGRITGNPAPLFFDNPCLVGENMEWMGIMTESRKPEQLYMHFLLSKRDEVENMGELIALLNIRYVVLLKEVDYEDYHFLYRQRDLKVILENAKIALFENQYKMAKIYWVGTVRNLWNWSQLLKVSQAEDLLTCLYSTSLQNEFKITSTSIFRPLHYTEVSPIEFEVDVSEGGYIIFSEPLDEGWTLNGQNPIANLGLSNAFSVENPGTVRIFYKKFSVLLPFYVASAIALIGFLLCLAVEKLKNAICNIFAIFEASYVVGV